MAGLGEILGLTILMIFFTVANIAKYEYAMHKRPQKPEILF